MSILSNKIKDDYVLYKILITTYDNIVSHLLQSVTSFNIVLHPYKVLHYLTLYYSN